MAIILLHKRTKTLMLWLAQENAINLSKENIIHINTSVWKISLYALPHSIHNMYTICRLNDDLFLCPFIIRKFEHKRSFCFSSLYSGPYITVSVIVQFILYRCFLNVLFLASYISCVGVLCVFVFYLIYLISFYECTYVWIAVFTHCEWA